MDLWLSCSLGCMGRGPLLSCLLKIHAIVGSTFLLPQAHCRTLFLSQRALSPAVYIRTFLVDQRDFARTLIRALGRGLQVRTWRCSANASAVAEQATVLEALVEAAGKLVAGRLSTVNMMNSLEYVVLALDELVDAGTILEIDGGAIAARVSMKSTVSDVPLHEQTPVQAFSSIREQLQRQFKLPSTG